MRSSAAPLWLGLVPIGALIVLWEAISGFRIVNPTLLPPLTQVLPVVSHIVLSGEILEPLSQTLAIMAAGYLIGCGIGCGLGLLMGWNRAIYDLFDPLVEIIRPIPKAALLPPLFLFLGMGLATKLVIVALAAFFPVLINTIQAVRGVSPVAIGTGRTLGFSSVKILFRIVLPFSLPMILAGMRISLALALILVVLAEMLVDSRGIGYVILDMQRSFKIRDMYAWIIILGVLGMLLNAAFEVVEKRLVPWRTR